jgi:hypothetical protein
VEVVGKPSSRALDILISINRELAGGLFTTPQAHPEEVHESNPRPNEDVGRPLVEHVAKTTCAAGDETSVGAAVRIST